MNGQSMEPALPGGAVVRIRCDQAPRLAVGGVVAFLAGGQALTVHRLVHVPRDSCYVVTRGDANLLCDPPLPLSDVVGLVEAWCTPGSDWIPVSSPSLRTGAAAVVRSISTVMMSRALAVHVRVAQAVALLGLALVIPRAALKYGLRSGWPPSIRMFRLSRPVPGSGPR